MHVVKVGRKAWLFGFAWLLWLLIAGASPVSAQTVFVVSTTADNGPGSLRQAILDANATANGASPDAIHFAIDATTDPGCDATTGVCTIEVATPLSDITEAVFIDGETQPGSACGSDFASRVLRIVIDGNNAGDGVDGIVIRSSNTTIRGLVINWFSDNGVRITSASSMNNTVACSFIGINETSTLLGSNGDAGVLIDEGATDNLVGGLNPGDGNLISSNNKAGVVISGAGTSDNLIQGNYIGTNNLGMQALGNQYDGVQIEAGASGNIIGGSAAGAGNLISGNYDSGVAIGSTGTANVVQGNRIGMNAAGSGELQNWDHGVELYSGAQQTTISDNEIAHNYRSGILLLNSAGSGNAFLRNSIYRNRELGIDLGGDGVTPNDAGDADASPNHLQNFPALSRPEIDAAGDLLVTFSVDSDPAHAAYPLSVEIFRVDEDYAEGQFFVGSTTYSQAEHGICGAPPCQKTANLGNAAALGISGTDWYVATATDADGNTSEFTSPAVGGDGSPSVFVVTNTNYTGPGSLGRAIYDANRKPNGDGPDEIHFNIDRATDPGCSGPRGACRIAHNVYLPLSEITDPVLIDGETQPGSTCGAEMDERVLLIIVDGGNAGYQDDGIVIKSHDTTIRGLVVNSFSGNGIRITGAGSTNNTIACNFIGIDVTGSNTRGNRRSGILIDDRASDNLIGGLGPGDGNIISGNLYYGIHFQGVGVSGNVIQGNYIGVESTGTASRGNYYNGVLFGEGPSENLIGGMAAGARNIISGNANSGLYLRGFDTDHNTIQGNYIGTDITGTLGVGNRYQGVRIGGGATGNRVGGSDAGAGNVISGNSQAGIVLSGEGMFNLVHGNRIGTNADGTGALGNDRQGIWLLGDVRATFIFDNEIAYNVLEGINLRDTAGHDNAILRNAIYSNGGLGIDLGGTISGDGVTPNDAGDADAGPNKLQNFPVITGARLSGTGDLLVEFYIDSDPAHAGYTITAEFFRADADGQEGQVFLGSVRYSAAEWNGCGTPPCVKTATLGEAATFGVVAGNLLLATARDGAGNTSEFSASVQVTLPVTRYVAPGGSDAGNDCASAATPCATFGHALDQANPGDVIDLAAGTYDEAGMIITKAVSIQGDGVLVY